MLTRRELLTAFLGAPIAMAACGPSGDVHRPFPEGSIVGQSVELGHILREGRSFTVASDSWDESGVVIVGGGIAGLSAAWHLKRKGFTDFTVLEMEGSAGGTSVSGVGEPVGFPWGAHYLPVPFKENAELVELLDEMELTEGRDGSGEPVIREHLLCREPEERVFYKGRWYEGLYLNVGASDDDKAQFARFQSLVDQWVNWRDAGGKRAFVVPIEGCSNDPVVTGLDRITFAEWLSQMGFSSERLYWYCDYATRDDYGLRADQASAWVGLFYFCSRVRKSGAESQPFITVPEGNGQFVRHFAATAAGKIRSSSIVVSITPKARGAEVVYLDVNRVPRGIRCRKVIYAAPLFTAPYIISGFRENSTFDLAEFQHNAWFVANLFLKDRPKPRFARDFPLSWDNVLYQSRSLGYVTATHQKGIDYGPTVLTYYYPMCAEPDGRTTLFNYDWRQLADVCLTDLARAHSDIYDLTTRIDIMRWGHAMVSPRPGLIWSGIRQRAAQPHRNIHFAHTDLSGVALFEEAFYHGLRAAGEVLAAV